GKTIYRQPMGETSTVALYNFLKSHATGNSLRCEVMTLVNKPNDVFDKYGRCVGDIIIRDKNGKAININQWMVEQGYAFPSFYNSMTNSEINDIRSLANSAAVKKLNIWKYYDEVVKDLDRKLVLDKKDPNYSASTDRKPPVIFPKLYRRLWNYVIAEGNSFT